MMLLKDLIILATKNNDDHPASHGHTFSLLGFSRRGNIFLTTERVVFFSVLGHFNLEIGPSFAFLSGDKRK